MDTDKSYCGFEDGNDWLDDLAIEDHLLRKETHESETENLQSDTLKRDLRRINL
jgi:hypothetical protein